MITNRRKHRSSLSLLLNNTLIAARFGCFTKIIRSCCESCRPARCTVHGGFYLNHARCTVEEFLFHPCSAAQWRYFLHHARCSKIVFLRPALTHSAGKEWFFCGEAVSGVWGVFVTPGWTGLDLVMCDSSGGGEASLEGFRPSDLSDCLITSQAGRAWCLIIGLTNGTNSARCWSDFSFLQCVCVCG